MVNERRTGTASSAFEREAFEREAFEQAARFFVVVAARVGPEAWDAPALGVWSIRDLVGHTSRALLTVETYLARPAERADVTSALDYFLNAAQATGGSGSIAQRGIAAGAALGDDPPRAVADIADRVLDLIRGVSDDALLGTPLGGMRLDDYLPTRTFELMVHTLDLVAALGVDVEPPSQALSAALDIAAGLAVRRSLGPTALLALTGRGPLPDGFSVLRAP